MIYSSALEAALKIDEEEKRSKGTLGATPRPHECLITWRGRETKRQGGDKEATNAKTGRTAVEIGASRCDVHGCPAVGQK